MGYIKANIDKDAKGKPMADNIVKRMNDSVISE